MNTSEKQSLRKDIITLLNNQKEDNRLAYSQAIAENLFETPEFRNAKTVLFYASCKGEVETIFMIRKAQEQGKMIGLPRTDIHAKVIIPHRVESLDKDLEIGAYNIRQPKPATQPLSLESIDLAVVPGVAFDKHNNRLGRGGGYYDRLLARLPEHIPVFGLAFDFQIVDYLPFQTPTDIPVSKVICN